MRENILFPVSECVNTSCCDEVPMKNTGFKTSETISERPFPRGNLNMTELYRKRAELNHIYASANLFLCFPTEN